MSNSVSIHKKQEVPAKLALTFPDKLLAAGNAVQWGLIGAAYYGVAPAVTVPISFAAGFASQAATSHMLLKNASWLRWALSSPLVTYALVSQIPIARPIAKAMSLYNLVKHSVPKLSEAWGELKANPMGAIKSGALHLFNLASGVAFAAESAGLIRLTPEHHEQNTQSQQQGQNTQSQQPQAQIAPPPLQNDKPYPSTCNSSPPICETVGQSDLCWQRNPLTPGVTHYKFDGILNGQSQRVQLLKVDPTQARLRVQDARGVFRSDEHPSNDRLTLLELAPRVSGAVAGITGGYFHYNPPKGEYYLRKEDGHPIANGDPVGELCVDGNMLSKNPEGDHWAAFRIGRDGEVSISDKQGENSLHSLGGAPLLIKDGNLIEEFGTALPLNPKQIATPGEFQYHMNAAHGRAAVCQDESNNVFLVAAEGRMKGATGFRMKEFGHFLKALGCKNAINLDGGGSVDLVTLNPDGDFVSTVAALDPQGKRPIATAILVESPLEQRIEMRLQQVNAEGQRLKKKVSDALRSGGQIVYRPGNSGIYHIKDEKGQTIAIFKAEDERAWGPANRNPDKRRAEPTEDDIEHLTLSAFHQGKASQRQYLAKLLDHGTISPLPKSVITEMESDLFFNVEAGALSKMQRKPGLLQEWVPNSEPLTHGHPIAQEFFARTLPNNPYAQFSAEATRFQDNPLLDRIPLDEFQKASVMNILLYNQDSHADNYLVTLDEQRNPHLVSIDMDTILPWRLSDLLGFTDHKRARQPFTKASHQLIAQLEPNYVRALAQKMGLSEQSCTNAKALALVLKRFSQANLSLADIHKFISNPVVDTPSPLWGLMEQCKQKAIDRLPVGDKTTYAHAKTLGWSLWNQGGINAPPDAQAQLNNYNLHSKDRIAKAVDQTFWEEFGKQLTEVIRNMTI